MVALRPHRGLELRWVEPGELAARGAAQRREDLALLQAAEQLLDLPVVLDEVDRKSVR